MELHRGLNALPLDIAAAGTAVTIGFFDGVHLGHRALLADTVDVAREKGLSSVAITFDRHPREILTPGSEPRLLTTIERKAELIGRTGIEHLVVLEFTDELAKVPAEEFVQRALVEGLRTKHTVVGANFTFGFKAMGTVEVLTQLGREHGFTVEGLGLVQLDGRVVSSSSVREAIAQGDLAWPEEALGRRYAVDGEVVTGAGRGTGLGFPTANLQTWPRLLLPGQGIYAGRAIVDGTAYVAAIDVGTNPTFGVEPLHVESYLLDFEGDLVGRSMDVEFWARLRDEVAFDTPEALSAQMAEDVERTRAIVGSEPG